MPLDCDAGHAAILVRRLIYEGALQRAVDREPRIQRIRTNASGLIRSTMRNGVPVLAGVRTTTRDCFGADLVIDATGRSSRAPQWLAAVGARPMVERCHDCGFVYLCRHYILRPSRTFPAVELPIIASLPYMDIVVFPSDNRTFSISIVLSALDSALCRLLDGAAFDRLLAAIPLTLPWMDAGIPTNEPHAMGRFINRWRRLVDADGPVAEGFLVAGDAAFGTSPALGRGVSLGFAQAQEIARAIDAGDDDSVSLVERIDRWGARHLGPWFESQLAEDSARDLRFNAVEGGSGETKPSLTSRVIAGLAALRQSDPYIRAAADRVFHLLMEPGDLLRDRMVLRSLGVYLNGPPSPFSSSDGPTRREMEEILVS